MIQLSIFLLLYVHAVIVCISDELYSKFQQNDYTLVFTRLELTYFNPDIYERFEMVTFKYNRTLAVTNATMKTKIQLNSNKIMVVMQVYKFLSNEYRQFPIHFQLNLCRLLQNNIAGANAALKCGNVKGCELKVGIVYRICNMHPDPSRFPPNMPNGEYKVEITLEHENRVLSTVHGYGKVSRAIKN